MLAGGEARLFRHEIGDRAGDLLRLPHAAASGCGRHARACIGLSGGLFLFHISVSVGPGPTALTVMFWSASSSAQLRVIATSPALAAV